MAASLASLSAIHRAYLAYYGRPADSAGLNYWAGVLDQQGGNLSAIIASFGNSQESEALYGGSTTAARVEKVYQQLFNRAPDGPGLDYWVGEIDGGKVSLGTAALAILNGAAGGDRDLILRKLDAAVLFTDTLRAQNMSHAYQAADIDAARDYLSAVRAGMNDTAMRGLLDDALGQIQTASLLTYSVASGTGFPQLSSAAGWDLIEDGGMVFANRGYLNSRSSYDALVVRLDDSLQHGASVSIGDSTKDEQVRGILSTDEGFVIWGRSDTRSGSVDVNKAFLWVLGDDLAPMHAIKLGATGGNAPEVNQVVELSNGKLLVVGRQNSVADGWDAYAAILEPNLTVSTQKRFDGPATGSHENFRSALELADGSLILLGTSGEMLRVNGQTLDLIGTPRTIGGVSELFRLDDGLIMGKAGNYFYVMDSNLNVRSRVYSNVLDELVEIAPGEFHAREYGSKFMKVSVDTSNPSAPVLTFENLVELTTRNGGSVGVYGFADAGDSTMVLNGNLIFSFNMDINPTPNLAADYRLQEGQFNTNWSVSTYNTLTVPQWEVFDVQIVQSSELPNFTPLVNLALVQQSNVIDI